MRRDADAAGFALALADRARHGANAELGGAVTNVGELVHRVEVVRVREVSSNDGTPSYQWMAGITEASSAEQVRLNLRVEHHGEVVRIFDADPLGGRAADEPAATVHRTDAAEPGDADVADAIRQLALDRRGS